MSTSTPPQDVSAPKNEGTFITRMMRPLNTVVERYMPSSLVFAILLTIFTGIITLILTDTGPIDAVQYWGVGLSGLLEFITQMALVLLLGHILAHTTPVRKALVALARIPKSPSFAYVFVFLVAALCSLITWGLGLVVGGLLAKEVAYQGRQRGLVLHFPMLVASGFAGFLVWHMGYSASGPLAAATEGSFLYAALGEEVVPVTETVYSSWNMLAVVATIALVALSLYLVAPRAGSDIIELTIDARDKSDDGQEEIVTPADKIDASRLPTLILGLILATYLVIHFTGGGTLTLDTVNWSFLALILLLVRNPFELIHLTKNAAGNVGEILLQFPLYAGILGLMTESGLVQVLSDAFVAIANPATFGVLAFISAGIVNFFVPSGGGQFAVQGPIMLQAGAEIGVDPSITIMAIAYGDQWTSMIQPFWAIPILAIAGLKMRDILGYTTIAMIASGLVFGATLLIVSL